MSRVIALTNQKGGVGKTTGCANIELAGLENSLVNAMAGRTSSDSAWSPSERVTTIF